MQQHDTQKQRTAWKLGQWLGSWYRAFLRQEARFVAWLAGHGMPVKVARILLWAFRIVAVLVLLYLAFWLLWCSWALQCWRMLAAALAPIMIRIG